MGLNLARQVDREKENYERCHGHPPEEGVSRQGPTSRPLIDPNRINFLEWICANT